MQKRVTFDHLFKCLGGDYPLNYYIEKNDWYLDNHKKLDLGVSAVANIKKFQDLLYKVRQPAVKKNPKVKGKEKFSPDWPHAEKFSDIIKQVISIYNNPKNLSFLFLELELASVRNRKDYLEKYSRLQTDIEDGGEEYWLIGLYKDFVPPNNNKQVRIEIILRLAMTNSENDYLIDMINDNAPEFRSLQKAWKLRELVHAIDESGAAPWRFYKSYGCAYGKGNAAEKAYLAWQEQNSPIHDLCK